MGILPINLVFFYRPMLRMNLFQFYIYYQAIKLIEINLFEVCWFCRQEKKRKKPQTKESLKRRIIDPQIGSRKGQDNGKVTLLAESPGGEHRD